MNHEIKYIKDISEYQIVTLVFRMNLLLNDNKIHKLNLIF